MNTYKQWFAVTGAGILVASTLANAATLGDTDEPLIQYSRSIAERRFTGSPITIQLKDADVTDVLRMIGEASGFNVIIHPQVTGKISLSMVNVPWDQALDVVLQTLNLGAERNESVLRILPSAILVQEKQADLQTKALAENSSPKVTRIFPISYANPEELVAILTTFGSATGATPPGAEKAAISVDKTTNSLVVRDSLANVERIKKLIELMDVQVPQVLIEAKVVEATEKFGKDLQGSLGVSQKGTSSGKYGLFGAFNGSNPIDTLVGANGLTGANISKGSLEGGLFGWSPIVGIFGENKLTAILKISESEQKIKVVSSPRTVVISGKNAKIRQSQVTYNRMVTATAGGGTQSSFEAKNSDLLLDVTPRVTNEGSVFMKITLQRDIVDNGPEGNTASAPRVMSSEVLVDSGSTLVIGGVMNEQSDRTESGIPYLRNIPILGVLFGGKNESSQKTELMFFITPKILNLRRAGIGGSGNG